MHIIAAEGTDLRNHLNAMVAPGYRCLFFVGVPGVGKSLWAQQAALLAEAQNRPVTLLQWDVVRRPLEHPPYDELLPEIDGLTHPGIRMAVNSWVRGAIAKWDRDAPDNALLIGETSLTQQRLSDVAGPIEDDAEQLLAGDKTLFVVPTPTERLRARFAAARAAEAANPAHDLERGSAPINVLEDNWRLLQAFGGYPEGAAAFDPDRYIAIYTRLLRHRHLQRLDIDEEFKLSGSSFDLPTSIQRLEIDPASVDAIAAPFLNIDADLLEQQITFLPLWF